VNFPTRLKRHRQVVNVWLSAYSMDSSSDTEQSCYEEAAEKVGFQFITTYYPLWLCFEAFIR